MRLILQTGLRAAEAARLRVGDLDLTAVPYRILVRGGKMRARDEVDEVVVPWALAAELRNVTRGCRASAPVVPRLDGRPYSRQGVWDMVSAAGAACGVKVYPHLLRHRYGTTLYETTRDLLVTQRQLRHRNPRTTTRYVHLGDFETRMQQMVDQLSLT